MLEVKYSADEQKTVEEFKKTETPSANDWLDTKFDGIKKTIKDHYLKEQDYTCFFCRQRSLVRNNRAWDTEHILSRHAHPAFMFHPRNLCVTCIDCNTEKSGKEVLVKKGPRVRFPEKSGAYKILHPHFDIYEDHLTAIVAGQLYSFHTPKGRATYNTYGLERFRRTAGRPKEPDAKIQKLADAAISNDDEKLNMLELEFLEHLAIKHADKIGPKLSIELLKKLKES